MSNQELKEKYPKVRVRWNFLDLVIDELSFERNQIYLAMTKPIREFQKQKKIFDVNGLDEDLRAECYQQIGYLDRLLLYLIDKLLQGNFSSFHMLRKNMEKTNKKQFEV